MKNDASHNVADLPAARQRAGSTAKTPHTDYSHPHSPDILFRLKSSGGSLPSPLNVLLLSKRPTLVTHLGLREFMGDGDHLLSGGSHARQPFQMLRKNFKMVLMRYIKRMALVGRRPAPACARRPQRRPAQPTDTDLLVLMVAFVTMMCRA
ncbi:hypothetical protein EVAR_45272_1 [Eumeta japonica]|uniref:Uncharacterized protein n=1 Tax=Eumeta variegata TaxID=151549 RepID=A0A4C1XE50_EUMVA|nr:hypothetical protein EVAR_45272_1 [Eumeta japonica]